jgi:hypothetical protein
MQTDTRQTSLERRSSGPWTHTGEMIVQLMAPDGTLMRVHLPSDLWALMAHLSSLQTRVDQLEAAQSPTP